MVGGLERFREHFSPNDAPRSDRRERGEHGRRVRFGDRGGGGLSRRLAQFSLMWYFHCVVKMALG